MVKLKIDNVEYDFAPHLTLLQACEMVGIEIPRFCYHERLSVAGNCRMCLVEIKGAPKPIVSSCNTQVKDLRGGPNGEPAEVLTQSERVVTGRKGVMEFLLINHPLDCPICDQGGECDLQDQAMGYGFDASRFELNKRAVEDKYIGPLVKTVMTRCIQCTRCVRFVTEVAGTPELGAVSRGENMEITTYLEQALTSELQGNLIDLCPVGALTSYPYAFTARPWELKKTYTVDVMDAIGANIRVDSRGNSVLRILPVENDAVNEEWITDKTRFVSDAFQFQRLDVPYVKKDNYFHKTDWTTALAAVSETLQGTSPKKIAVVLGPMASLETTFSALQLFKQLGVEYLDFNYRKAFLTQDPSHYLLNSTIEGFEQLDTVLLVGCNPRLEGTLLNTRLRKAHLERQIHIGVIGEAIDLTYDYDHLGDNASILDSILLGQHPYSELLKQGKAAIVLGYGALTHVDAEYIVAKSTQIANQFNLVTPEFNGFNVLHQDASTLGALMLGFRPSQGTYADIEAKVTSGDIEVVYLIGADDTVDFKTLNSKVKVIYQGSHGDKGAQMSDILLPSASYVEQDGLYMNVEGRIQMGNRAVEPVGEAKPDWKIFKQLSLLVNVYLPFSNLGELREDLMFKHPHLNSFNQPLQIRQLNSFITTERPSYQPIHNYVKDYYLTNAITRNSKTLTGVSEMNHKRKGA